MNGSNRNLARDASGLAVARLAIRFVGAAIGLVVARVLGPEGLAQLSLPNLVLTITPFLAFGLPDALLRELPLATDEPTRQKLLSTAWHASVVAMALLVVFALVGQTLLRGWIADPVLLGLAVASGLANAAYKVSYCELIGLRRVKELAVLQIIQGFARSLLVLGLLFCLPATAQVYALHAGVAVSLLASLLWASTKQAVHRPAFHRDAFRRLMSSGPPLAVASMFMTLLIVGDRMVMGKLLPAVTLGYFEQSVLIRDGLLLLPAVLLTLLIPDYAARQGDPHRRAQLIEDVVRQSRLVAAMTPVLLGMLTLQLPWVIGWILPRFLPGLPIMQVAVLAMCPVFLSYILVSLLLSEGRSGLVGGASAGSLGLLLVLEATLLRGVAAPSVFDAVPPGFGHAFAAGVAALAAFWMNAISVSIGSLRRLGLRPVELLGWAAPSLTVSALLLLAMALGWLQEWNPWLNLAALLAASLHLWAYESRSGQLRKLWRARRAGNS